MTENAITIRPHSMERVIPGGWNHAAQEYAPERSVVEPREGFTAEWPAERLSAWGRTRTGAVSMLETMLAARG